MALRMRREPQHGGELLGVPFEGVRYAEAFVLGDVRIEGAPDELSQSVGVLSGGPEALAQVAQPADPW